MKVTTVIVSVVVIIVKYVVVINCKTIRSKYIVYHYSANFLSQAWFVAQVSSGFMSRLLM